MTVDVKITSKKKKWTMFQWFKKEIEIPLYHYWAHVTAYNWDGECIGGFVMRDGTTWEVEYQDGEELVVRTKNPILQLEQNNFKTIIFIYE